MKRGGGGQSSSGTYGSDLVLQTGRLCLKVCQRAQTQTPESPRAETKEAVGLVSARGHILRGKSRVATTARENLSSSQLVDGSEINTRKRGEMKAAAVTNRFLKSVYFTCLK